MSLVLPCLLLVVSLFLLYQGLCFFGLLPFDALILEKFTSNNFLLLIRAVLSKYTLILGVVGLALAVFLFICYKSKTLDGKSSSTFWGIFIVYAVVALFTVI